METLTKILGEITTWLLNRENITDTIAVVGFGISLYNFFRVIWDRRCAFDVDYVGHYSFLSKNKKYAVPMFRLNFVNQSSAPLTVVRMFLLVGGNRYEFLFPEQQVYAKTRHQNNNVTLLREVQSQAIPFRVEGKGALGGYFALHLPVEMNDAFRSAGTWTLVVQTPQKQKEILIVANNPGCDVEQYGC